MSTPCVWSQEVCQGAFLACKSRAQAARLPVMDGGEKMGTRQGEHARLLRRELSRQVLCGLACDCASLQPGKRAARAWYMQSGDRRRKRKELHPRFTHRGGTPTPGLPCTHTQPCPHIPSPHLEAEHGCGVVLARVKLSAVYGVDDGTCVLEADAPAHAVPVRQYHRPVHVRQAWSHSSRDISAAISQQLMRLPTPYLYGSSTPVRCAGHVVGTTCLHGCPHRPAAAAGASPARVSRALRTNIMRPNALCGLWSCVRPNALVPAQCVGPLQFRRGQSPATPRAHRAHLPPFASPACLPARSLPSLHQCLQL